MERLIEASTFSADGEVRRVSLCDRMDMNSSTFATALRRLEGKGMVAAGKNRRWIRPASAAPSETGAAPDAPRHRQVSGRSAPVRDRLLQIVKEIGEPVTARQVAILAGHPPDAVGACLSKAAKAGLIVQTFDAASAGRLAQYSMPDTAPAQEPSPAAPSEPPPKPGGEERVVTVVAEALDRMGVPALRTVRDRLHWLEGYVSGLRGGR